jgi:hypothetical protein
MEQQDKIIKARIQKQEKRVARAQAELARLKESEKSQARKRRTKAMIILGATLERAVPMAARAELHSLILQHERDSEWVCRLVLALAARLSPPPEGEGANRGWARPTPYLREEGEAVAPPLNPPSQSHKHQGRG